MSAFAVFGPVVPCAVAFCRVSAFSVFAPVVQCGLFSVANAVSVSALSFSVLFCCVSALFAVFDPSFSVLLLSVA